jgi:hypothetical protein
MSTCGKKGPTPLTESINIQHSTVPSKTVAAKNEGGQGPMVGKVTSFVNG